ncbi:MAG: hypothetical protein JO019_02095 [Candidatus Kaiserbacteria bacterium]|nr:hypothetical protein [Candidatus Kaiserbacteria bacterium]
MAEPIELQRYFRHRLARCRRQVGLEIETLMTKPRGNVGAKLISFGESQELMRRLARSGWDAHVQHAGDHLVLVRDPAGFSYKYDAGHANFELACPPDYSARAALHKARDRLEQLYRIANSLGISPLLAPCHRGEEDTLIDLEPRDRFWLTVDGRDAFAPIARIASFQATFDVAPEEAIELINRLLQRLEHFYSWFPQFRVWQRYVHESKAGYRGDRFGGPMGFESIEEYCARIAEHKVGLIKAQRLVPFAEADLADTKEIALFIRSVWWHFRLRRNGDQLCIEVRPIGRYPDDELEARLAFVCELVGYAM